MAIYRVRATIAGVSGLPGLSTCYFEVTAPHNGADALACAGRVRSAWDVLKTIVPATVGVTVQPSVDVLDEATGNLITSFGITPPAMVIGTGSATAMPAQVAAGLVLATPDIVNNRRVRGRLYLSPLTLAAMTGGTPPAGTITAVNAFGVALISASPPITPAPPVVWARPAPGRPGTSHRITAATCATKWFTLRSRLN